MKFKKVKYIKLPKKLKAPILSKTKFDEILSYNGGLMPATAYGIYGNAGSGKTTVAFYLSGQIANNLPYEYYEDEEGMKKLKSVLNIQCEMEESEIEEYATRIDMEEIVPLDLLTSQDPKKELEEYLDVGWDVVTIDSFNELVESIMVKNKEKRYV